MKTFGIFAKKASFSLQDGRELPQILALLAAAFSTLMMGSVISWPSPSIPKLLEPEYGTTIEEASYLTVMDPIAMMIGSPVFCILADKIGRKRTMLITPFLFLTTWLMTAFTKNIYLLYLGRFIGGFGYACTFGSVPTYIAEVTNPKIRRRFGNVMMTMVFLGQLIINSIGYYCTISTTALIMLSFPILGVIINYFTPESPYFYIQKENEEKARRSLKILRGTQNIDAELASMTAAVKRQLSEPGHFKDLFTVKSNRKALIICNVARGIQQMSGVSTFMAYTQYIFEQAGTNLASGHGAMIFSGMLILSNIFSNFLSDKVGKRLAMVFSSFGTFIALLGESVYFYLQQYTEVDLSMINWFPVFGLGLFVLFFCIGQSNVPTILMGELFSASVKPHGVMFMNIAFAIYMAGTNKLFQYLMTSFGLCIPFFLFTICAFVGIFLSYFLIPDTEGKTLEEIQIMLKGKSNS